MNHAITHIFTSIVIAVSLAYSAESECSNLIQFKNFMEHEYLPQAENFRCLNENDEEDKAFNDAYREFVRRNQKNALLMLQEGKMGKNHLIGDRNLAAIAAACGKYEWMRECIENGDEVLPAPNIFASALTYLISGIGDIPLKITLEDRIREADWIFSQHNDIFFRANPCILAMAAQYSGIHGNDKGCMFDYLLAKGMPLSCEIICMLMSVEGSLHIARKHHVLDALSKSELEKVVQYLSECTLLDKKEKIYYVEEILRAHQ